MNDDSNIFEIIFDLSLAAFILSILIGLIILGIKYIFISGLITVVSYLVYNITN